MSKTISASGWVLRRASFPLLDEHAVELAPVGGAGQAVAEREVLELLLQPEQLVLGLLAFADVEHEADQRLDLAGVVAHHVDDVANPDVFAARRHRPVVGLVVDAGLRLRHAVVDDPGPVVGVHALDPVVDADPARRRPAEERFDLRSDVREGRGGPVDLPRDGPGRFEQGAVDGGIGLHVRGGLAGAAEHSGNG